mgnify:CR=1 FL=1
MPYALERPPLRAPVSEHAETVSLNAFRVSPRTMERWGVMMTHVQGKRQPLTSEVWAAVLARLPASDHAKILGSMPQTLSDEVMLFLPAATEFFGGAV